ncbi:MAG: tRNA lysidine(34) synthetase TilS [Defluviitaleaceae bacterium]|nr:tRNA lysidine(34) synthetase TilS [Defluviitaleaceae bacterium]
MPETMRKTIEKYKMISRGDSVIVGLSGGADSVALLCGLKALREELGIGEIIAVHVNHNLRGTESDADEAFVRGFCEKHGVELVVYSADVKGFAVEKKLGIEEAARKTRYDLYEKARQKFSADKIAVGHNLDDNAESIIMSLCRGAGLKGLGGIAPVNGNIIRPLIETARAEIEKYLCSEKIEFITDTSNASNEYTRNRVRNLIIPLLEAEINPNVKATITRNAELLRDDEDFLDIYSKNIMPQNINIPKLITLPPAISRRVIRNAIAQVNAGLTDITAAHVSAVLELATLQTGREIHLPCVIVTREYDKLVFRKASNSAKGFYYELKKNSTVYIPEIDKSITLSQKSTQNYTKTFCYDKITKPLVLRTRRAGDKISFKNAEGRIFTKKLQDYFTDEKIPKSRRDEIPLLAHGSEILWIMNESDRTNAKFDVLVQSFQSGINTLFVSI